MKKQIKILTIFLITILFFNCSKDDHLENHSHGTHNHNDEVSFKQFKNETGITKFDYYKKANISKSTDFQARTIESEFITDTTGIKKYVDPINNKTTYSFKIYPIAETLSSNEYYNLVYEKIGTEWNEIIFFNTEKTNSTDGGELESSEMVYNRVSGREGFTEVITYSFHCTQTGPCAGGSCDMCNLCVSTHVTYVYTGIEDSGNGSIGNPPGSGNPPSNGGGGEGNGIYIPNPYDGEADPNNADFMLAGQVASFTNTLPNNLQTLISNYPFIYPYLVDFCRNNGYTVNSRNTQKMTTALTNFYNFQLNTSYTNLTFVNIDRFNFWAFYTFLNNNQNDSNTQRVNDIKNHIISTNYNNANSIINYLFNNLITDFPKFENLYTTPVEGKDFNYDSNYWNNPNLSFNSQDLPTWDEYNNAYPRNSDGSYMTGADNVYGYVGGAVLQARLNYPNDTNNTCALKVSIALNGSGVTIPNIPGTLEGGGVNAGKYYFLNAKALNNWMKLTFGTSPSNPNHKKFVTDDISSAETKFNEFVENNTPSQGIYTMLPSDPTSFGASGHCDKFDGSTCAAGCYLGQASEINLWILN